MKARKLATRDARALGSALPDPAAQDAAADFLTNPGAAIAGSSDVELVCLNPAIPRRTKKAIVAKLAGEFGAGHTIASFLGVVVDHGRAPSLPDIAQAFHEIREHALGIVHAAVTTAAPLSADMETRMRSTLERLTGKRIRLTARVDRALIGGAVTQIGSTVYDGSVRTQLANLRRRMAGQ